MSLEQSVEFYGNPEPRVPFVLILDTSGSMSGAPINELNQGLVTFKEEVLKDSKVALRVEIAIVTFGNLAQLHQDFVTVDNFYPPNLEASGLTPMGEAIELALETLERRKLTYKINGIKYYQPWAWLVTDGAPNLDSPWQRAVQRIHTLAAEKKLSFFAIGCGEAVNMDILRQIAEPLTPPVMLKGLNFEGMFRWLAQTVTSASQNNIGDQYSLPPTDGWATRIS